MKISRYSIRNGCCHYWRCCDENDRIIYDSNCCCYLYSFSLQASNDNFTWKVLHKVEKDNDFDIFQTKTFELEEISQPYKYLRFVVDEEYPNCYKYMQINQIEFYGENVFNEYVPYSENTDDDESISIIGRVNKNEQ